MAEVIVSNQTTEINGLERELLEAFCELPLDRQQRHLRLIRHKAEYFKKLRMRREKDEPNG